jgi:Ca2+-binding RTX toxin-like protein
MLRPVFGRLFGISRTHKSRPRRLQARVEGLEIRSLLTVGSVVQSGGLVSITPASSGANVAIVSYQNVKGTMELNVNLNGSNFDFSLSQVGFVYYEGSGVGGSQTFQNMTSLHTVAWGGTGSNLFESSGGAQDEFFGGSGSNTFDAGSGFDVLIGGSGPNTFNESPTGCGEIVEVGSTNTVTVPPGATGFYYVIP